MAPSGALARAPSPAAQGRIRAAEISARGLGRRVHVEEAKIADGRVKPGDGDYAWCRIYLTEYQRLAPSAHYVWLNFIKDYTNAG